MNKTLYILCAALALSACNSFIEEDMVENNVSDRTLSLKVNLPDFKPTFTDADTRGITTNNAWEIGDELLIVVNQSDGSRTETERITLTYNGSTWDVPEDASMITSETVDFSEAITLTVSERLATATTTIFPEITIYHAPECKWEDGSLNLKESALTSTPEVWNVSVSGLTWETSLARLCIQTGTPEDRITLTSTGFSPHLNFKKDDGIYTATTDAEGKAYFYGTLSESTDGFEVILTDLEQGSLTYDDVNLMKASALVPVSLAQGTSYIQDVTSLREDIAYEMNSIITNGGYLVATDGTYEVYTYEGLMAWNAKANTTLSTSMKLMRDITFPDGVSWTPIGNYNSAYSGKIDGNGKTITGMDISSTDITGVGFIGYLTGEIINLTLDNASVSGNSKHIGGFAGTCTGTISGCTYNGSVSGTYFTGGITGSCFGNGKIIKCINTSTVNGNGNNRIGGIVGESYGSSSIIACGNTGTVSGWQYVGGIVGNITTNASTIGCWTCNTQEVDDSGTDAATKDGIGYSIGTITDCYSGDAATINGKVNYMNTALNGYGYSWTAGTDGSWPTLSK